MLLGFNLLLWTSFVTHEHFGLLEELKAAGYDGVELPLFDGTPEHYRTIGRALKNNGLRATGVAVIPDANHDCTSKYPKIRANGLKHLHWAIDCLEAAGGETLAGPFYQPLGEFSGEAPTKEERAGIVEVHKDAAKHAARVGINLSVEPLNRFECYALNTIADAADIVRKVDEPNYGLLYDTFHVNIEEKDPVGVIGPNIAHINHVHTSATDRGTPGKDHAPWPETFKALKGGGYDSWYVIEAFGASLPGISAATKVWRDFFPNRDEVVEFGHDFLRKQWADA